MDVCGVALWCWCSQVLSPLDRRVLLTTKQVMTGYLLKVCREPLTILAYSAMRGFKDIPSVWLEKAARDKGVEWNKKDSLLGKIERLIRACLPNASDESIVESLAGRASRHDAPSILQDSEVRDQLDGVMGGEERGECTERLRDISKKQKAKQTVETYLAAAGKKLPSKAGAIGTDIQNIVLSTREEAAPAPQPQVVPRGGAAAARGAHVLHLPADYREWIPKGMPGCTLQAVPDRLSFLARYPRLVPPRSRTITYARDATVAGKGLRRQRPINRRRVGCGWRTRSRARMRPCHSDLRTCLPCRGTHERFAFIFSCAGDSAHRWIARSTQDVCRPPLWPAAIVLRSLCKRSGALAADATSLVGCTSPCMLRSRSMAAHSSRAGMPAFSVGYWLGLFRLDMCCRHNYKSK